MNRRAQVAMSVEETAAFLAERDLLTCATLGRDGWPHLMPLWYAVRDGDCWAWTYAKSQKVRNLERDPRCTVQIEAGTAYHELRGVMIKARCDVERDPDAVAAAGEAIAARHFALDDAARAAVHRQASKRVALRFAARETATWDHRKL